VKASPETKDLRTFNSLDDFFPVIVRNEFSNPIPEEIFSKEDHLLQGPYL